MKQLVIKGLDTSDLPKALPLVLFFCFGMLIFVNPPLYGPFWTAAQNTAHLVLFSGASLLLIAAVDQYSRLPFTAKLLGVSVLLLLVGTAAELVQTLLPGRTASISDMVLNLLGVVLGLTAYCIFYFRRSLGWLGTIPLTLLVIVVFLWNCRPVLEVLAYDFLKSKPPVLFAFSDSFVYTNITPAGGAQAVQVENYRHGGKELGEVLQMKFSEELYSRVILHDPSGPWTDYEYLALNIVNDSEQTRRLHMRIDDVFHNEVLEDRFRTSFELKPGLNTIRLPVKTVELVSLGTETRRMDMQQLTQMQFFSVLRDEFTVYLLDVKLENEIVTASQ